MTLPNQDNDLDEKLRDLLIECKAGEPVNEYVAIIRQAFADAGYVDQKQHVKVVRQKLETLRGNSMSGQEWYDHYQYEKGQGSLDNLKDMPHSEDYSNGIDHAVIKCDEAAKRAAGLQND